MNAEDDITNIGSGIPNNAVSLYGQDDAMEDFPVLKAFQQYIDAEQEKARKRMLMLCAFFGVLMTLVIVVFVVLLINVSSHNQALNDRLIDFAIKERATVQPSGSAVVVQPPQDNSALLKLTEKLDDMQKKLAESQQAVAAAEERAAKASRPKEVSPEEKEIIRLKALLSAEKEKAAADKEKLRQAELEAYRRKHYPELYETLPRRKKTASRHRTLEDEAAEADKEIESILKEDDAISYFDEEEEEEEKKQVVKPSKKRSATPSPSEKKPEPKKTEPKKNCSIPVDIKGSSSNWNIPLD